MLFKPGFSKKYPQYDDIKPDTKVIKPEVWDFALSRDCYFDYDDVLNGYYIFHRLRKLGKFFFNSLLFIVILIYLFVILILHILQAVYFLFYMPFKFFYLPYFFSALILELKLAFVFLYLAPVFAFLLIFLIIYFPFKFFYLKFKDFNNVYISKFFYLSFLDINAIFRRVQTFIFFIVFKLRSLNYVVFNSSKIFFSLNNLFNLGYKLSSAFFNMFNSNVFYGNLIYYNSSFVFKRIRPYLLRFNNTQFLKYFIRIQNTSRVTPDQFKSFFKIALNAQYPVYYFERLFDIEYSRMELEYELPYY